ncbi:MAG: cell division protein FtsA, partial [Pseudomonadota bacterium]
MMFSVRTKEPRSGSSRAGTLAALDVGTDKVTCLIARLGEPGGPRAKPEIIGVGHQVSEGIKAGTIVDMERAGEAIRAAVEAAERQANIRVQRVIANVLCGDPDSRTIHVELDLHGNAVSEQDIRRIVSHGRQSFDLKDREVLHVLPVGYALDGCRGIKDPREMFGERLGVDLNFVSAGLGPIRNLMICVERCHIDLAAMVYGAYASGIACLTDDERNLGVTCIDMGAGTTSLAVFAEGELQFAGVVPIGGQLITHDLARGLSTPIEHAERLKTMHGSVLRGARDDQDMLSIVQVGEEHETDALSVPKSVLTKIIRARVEETFEHVRERIDKAGFGQVAGNRVVLTGGASQLNGVRELAGDILGKQVRLGAPHGCVSGTDPVVSPAFSACVGLLGYAAKAVSHTGLGEFELMAAA